MKPWFSPPRLTWRGAGALGGGLALVIVGLLTGLPALVGLGTAALSISVFAWVSLGLARLSRGRSALLVTRQIQPNPVVRGEASAVHLSITPAHPTATALERLARLQLAEQAPPELIGPHPLRAQVAARPASITVTYQTCPARRGRWPLGPIMGTRTDPFGLVRATAPLGGTSPVTVWPRTTELFGRLPLPGELELAGTGAHLAAADDATLREYVTGDDPRRIHWPTMARLNRPMVRSDEASGSRPVTVLLDRALLLDPDSPLSAGHLTVRSEQWVVELAASIALALLRNGHAVRLVTPGADGALDGTGFVTGAAAGQAELLNSTVDLAGHKSRAAAEANLVDGLHTLRGLRAPGEVLIALLGPQSSAGATALTELAVTGWDCLGLVVTDPTGSDEPAAEATVVQLNRAEWVARQVAPLSDPGQVWTGLLAGAGEKQRPTS